MTIRGVVESPHVASLCLAIALASLEPASARAQDSPPGAGQGVVAGETVAGGAAVPAELGLRTPELGFEARWSMARSLLVAGRFAEAEERLRLLTAEEPLRLEPWLDLLHAILLRGRSLEAYRLVSRIEALAPGHPDVALVDAAIAQRAGDPRGAQRRLRLARTHHATHPALEVAERALEHHMDPVHVLLLPPRVADEWLASLDEAESLRTSGHWLGGVGALLGVGAIASVFGGLVQSFGCVLGGCSEGGTALSVLGGLLGAMSIGLVVAAGLTHHEASVRRTEPMARFSSRKSSSVQSSSGESSAGQSSAGQSSAGQSSAGQSSAGQGGSR